MIQLFSEDDKCCGCGACAAICPHHAIEMHPDEYGFIYPVVDGTKCVECRACLKVCNFQTPEASEPSEAYAAQRKGLEIGQSASGGVFAALATAVIAETGVAFGCALRREGTDLLPTIDAARTLKELPALFGSKYVQSTTNRTYKEVRKILQEGFFVLYSGLPCQISGLKGFLKKDYGNLLTVDVICHGTPNAMMFNSFIRSLESKDKEVAEFNFRSKKSGWGKFVYECTFRNKTERSKKTSIHRSYKSSPYYRMFLESSIYRDSCYNCPFASRKRAGDITIGDCWGIEHEHPEFDHTKGGMMNFRDGVSCILINSNKGHSFLNRYADSFVLYPVSLDSIARYNHQLVAPSRMHSNRSDYLYAFKQGGYSTMARSYYRNEWRHLLKEFISQYIPKCIKRWIRRK